MQLSQPIVLTLLVSSLGLTPLAAQETTAPLTSAFARSSSIKLNVREMLGAKIARGEDEAVYGPGAPDLWIAEVQFRPPRMIRMQVTDLGTGKSAYELVWYLVYRFIPRNYIELAGDKEAQDNLQRRLDDIDLDPQNEIDDVVSNNIVVPRFVLQTTDEGSEKRYIDEVNRQIQTAIFRREFRNDASGRRLINSADNIEEVGEPISFEDRNALRHAVYGVALWRNVDPETDFFKIEMKGFSNAYRLTRNDAGRTIIEDKIIVQKFARPGDHILQDEGEFRIIGEPEWIYQARNVEFDLADSLTVLRGKEDPAITQ